MSFKREVSFLPKEELEQKALGRVLIWVLSTGRWIVVLTEFIVICAFLSRFYLDREIADLHDDIFQKQAIVEAMSNFEEEFKSLQTRIETIDELVGQAMPNEILETIIPVIPNDVFLNSFDFQEDKIEISAVALSYQGLANFWYDFGKLENFANVKITKIGKEEQKTEITFTIVADFSGRIQ